MKRFSKFILICITAIPTTALATEPIQVKVANMSQDLSFLTKEVAQLRLEIETLSRENHALKRQLDQLQLSENQLKALQSKQDAQITGLNTALESYKKTMLTQVADEMENFSKQTQKAIDQLAKSVSPPPPPPGPSNFPTTTQKRVVPTPSNPETPSP